MPYTEMPSFILLLVTDRFYDLLLKIDFDLFTPGTKQFNLYLTYRSAHRRDMISIGQGSFYSGACSLDHLDLEVYCDVALC